MNINDLLKTKAGQDPENRARLEQAAHELAVMGGIRGRERQPNQRPALEPRPPQDQKRIRGVGVCKPLIRVSFISCRRRLITDSDNFPSAFKALRDAIAASFGFDDADLIPGGLFTWEYGQVVTSGEQGTIVRIEVL